MGTESDRLAVRVAGEDRIMKAIYTKRIKCVVIEDFGDSILLEPIDGTEKDRFEVPFDVPGLIVDPTDDEWMDEDD